MVSVVGERGASISNVLAQHLFDTSIDLFLVTDRRGKFIEISPSATTILGYRPEEMIGRIGTEFIHPDDLERTRQEMRQARRGRETRNFESRYVHKRGNTVMFDWNGVWSESEQLHFFIGRDVTVTKLAERLKNEFVATVSHELRTPLTSINGVLGLLVADDAAALPASTRRLLTIAQTNCWRLLHLVNGILDVEEIDSGKVVFASKQIEIRALLERAITSSRAAADGHDVHIRLDAASGTSELRGDPEWLVKAVGNLLSNAIKFSPPGGEVVVGVEKQDEKIRISVRDWGPGIPEAFKGRVFEKFAQADAADPRNKGGAGLGLSIVKEIVVRLGGNVSFADAPGGGSIFYVELPVWKQEFETAS